MRRFMLLLLAVILFAPLAYTQPVLREGWPQDFSSASNNPFTSVNPLAVAVAEDGTHYIATGTTFHVRLYTLDGTLVQQWATNDLVPEEPTADYLAGGPQIADVDGDGDLEVIVLLRRNTASTRALAVLELDGSLNTTLSRGHTLTAVDISTFACADVDDDGFDEIVYSTSAEIHAIDQDGSEVEGFPWNVDRPHVGGGPVIVPSEYNQGTSVIIWPGQDLQMHAREFDAAADLDGWPVTFVAPTGFQMAPPLVIPTDTGWLVAMVSVNGVYLWDQAGVLQEGFPVMPQNVDASLLMFSGAADLDGDDIPEIMFRSWNSDYISAVSLTGSYLTGYPWSTGTEAGRSESIAVIKMATGEVAYQFFASLGPGGNDLGLFGQQGTTALPGFPVNLTTVENVPMASTAIFAPVAGSISIVYHTQMGFTTVYNLEVDAGPDGTIEWGMPFGKANGNRVYEPQPLIPIESPIFAFTPSIIDFGDVEVGVGAEQEITVQNNGSESGEITSADFVHGIPAGDLSLSATLPLTLAAGESAIWTLSWMPSVAGGMSDSIHVVHDEDLLGTESYIKLLGTGVQYPELVIPETIDFGTIYTDNPVGTASLVIQNLGDGEGIIDTVLIATAHTQLLSVQQEFPISIEPGGTVSISLLWEPLEAIQFNSQIQVMHNDPALGGQTVVQVTGVLVNDVEEGNLPTAYALEQNHPNPFNPETTIRYSLKDAGVVTLKVYNIEGKEVATLVRGQRDAGRHEIRFDGRRFASGVYIYSIEVNDFRALKKMVLVQ